MTSTVRHIVVVGDATLDVTVRSPARTEAGKDRPAEITVGPGGQGANVGVRLARAGASVQLVAAIGQDTAGSLLAAALEAEGVELIRLDEPRTAMVVSLVDERGERAMLSDRSGLGADAGSRPEVLDAIAQARWIHVSGYALADAEGGDALAWALARRPGAIRLSIGGGSFGPGARVGPRLAAARPDLLLFDRSEAELLLGQDASSPEREVADLARGLASTFHAVAVVTDGGHGSAAALDGEAVIEVGAVTADATTSMTDATGAGDAFAASVIQALEGTAWPPDTERLRAALQGAAERGAQVAGAVGAQAVIPAETRS